MENLVRAVLQKEGLRAGEIRLLSGGQVNQVFLVDQTCVVRIGGRDDAAKRLELETGLLRRLEGKTALARVFAFGQMDGFVYQIQQYIPGKMLCLAWKGLSAEEQEAVIAGLAESMKVIHSLGAPFFGDPRQEDRQFPTWAGFLSNNFKRTLQELDALQIRMAPGFVELAGEYFEKHIHVLQGGLPTVVHSDMTLMNILVENGRLAAVLDFEYAMQAPADYELWAMEAFCLYPNDWAEEGNEVYCSADFARVIPLLQKHYPELFAVDHLRERVNLYQLEAALGSYLAWRKSNLDSIPPERMAAKEFYMARIANFVFSHGARMFF